MYLACLGTLTAIPSAVITVIQKLTPCKDTGWLSAVILGYAFQQSHLNVPQ